MGRAPIPADAIYHPVKCRCSACDPDGWARRTAWMVLGTVAVVGFAIAGWLL